MSVISLPRRDVIDHASTPTPAHSAFAARRASPLRQRPVARRGARRGHRVSGVASSPCERKSVVVVVPRPGGLALWVACS